MTGTVNLEHAWAEHRQVRQDLLRADERDFERCLGRFVHALRENMLAGSIVRELPPADVRSWWDETLERAESSFGPAELRWPGGDARRLSLLAELLSSMTQQTDCTVEEFGMALACPTPGLAVSAVQELVVRPLCDLLEERFGEASATEASRLAS